MSPGKPAEEPVVVDARTLRSLLTAVKGLVEQVEGLRAEVRTAAGDAATARARCDALTLQVQAFTRDGAALLLRPVKEEP